MLSDHNYQLISIESIFVDREERQRRELQIDELEQSIRKVGLLQPIIVEAYGGTGSWKLVAGECRLEACRRIGWTTIPARLLSELTTLDRSIAELEENIKRTSLSWLDNARAVQKIHLQFQERNPEWTQVETAAAISTSETRLSEQLIVMKYVSDERIMGAKTLREAYNIVQRREARGRGDALMQLLDEPEEHDEVGEAEEITVDESMMPTSVRAPTPKPRNLSFIDQLTLEAEATILHADFLEWAPNYSGPKFNLLHCDFPYGIDHGSGPQARGNEPSAMYADTQEIGDRLFTVMVHHLDKFLSVSAHVMFWFAPQHYHSTIVQLSNFFPSITWHHFPLIWVKSDNSGISSDARRVPRHVYEVCLLGSRGGRQLVSIKSDAYTAPSDRKLHPSCKPEPMLKHFMSMLVDEHTVMLDPTCGSGSALRAAEALGAKSTLGLESNFEYCNSARTALRNARALKR